METQLFLTIQELSSVLSMAMEYGLTVSLLGLNMPLWTLQDLQHHMMVFTGIHHPLRGNDTFSMQH